MKYQIRVRPEAEADLKRLYCWYEEICFGLGDQMLADFEAALLILTENPRLYAKQYRQVRRQLLRVFPVGLYYTIVGEVVHIISVDHLSRDPDRWKKRV